MSNLISGSCFIRVAMLRMCLGLVFVGLAVAAHTAQSEEGSFVPGLDILTIQPVRPDADWLLPYRLNTNIALTRSADTAPIGSGFSNTPRLPLAAEPEKEIVPATNAYWQPANGGDHISLQRLLSVKFIGEQANITFRPRSALIEVEQFKITLRSQSVSIEGERLKIMLQPQSVSILWGKTF